MGATEPRDPRLSPAPNARLSRILTRPRWPEYGRLLKTAIGCGYRLVGVAEFLQGDAGEGPVLILRHDVDRHPAAALRMSDVERRLGVRSTWYLRWRTARPGVIEELRRRGGEIGFHYETLSRMALSDHAASGMEEKLSQGREILRSEITAFNALHGPIRGVAAHGDTRAPGVRNRDLLHGEDPTRYGAGYDADEALASRPPSARFTDRPGPGWSGGTDPVALLHAGVSPILCLTHPNNWATGSFLLSSLVADALGRVSDFPPAPPP